jgi:DNA polymerase III subunit chi
MRTYQKHVALSMMLSLPRISLPIPCQALQQGNEIPCGRTAIRAQAIDFSGIGAGPRKNFPAISLPAGKFVMRLDVARRDPGIAAIPPPGADRAAERRDRRALPKLLERARTQGHRVVVRAGSPERVESLSAALWTYEEAAFLPHGSVRDGQAAAQPIWLTHREENPNGASILVLVDGVEAEDLQSYSRCADLFDGSDADAVAAARGRWRRARPGPLAPRPRGRPRPYLLAADAIGLGAEVVTGNPSRHQSCARTLPLA